MNKAQQKELLTQIMEADANDGLYDEEPKLQSATFSHSYASTLKFKEVLPKKAVGWYCIGHEGFYNTTAFATYYKPNAIKRFFMRTLLDFYWIKDENK